jgi:hypothetical protein
MPAIKIEMLFEKYFFPKASPFDDSICATQISLYCPFYARSGEPVAGGSGRVLSPIRDRGVLHPHFTSRYRNNIHIFGRILQGTLFISVLRIRIRGIRMFFGLLDPDSLVRCTGPDPDPYIIKQK